MTKIVGNVLLDLGIVGNDQGAEQKGKRIPMLSARTWASSSAEVHEEINVEASRLGTIGDEVVVRSWLRLSVAFASIWVLLAAIEERHRRGRGSACCR